MIWETWSLKGLKLIEALLRSTGPFFNFLGSMMKRLELMLREKFQIGLKSNTRVGIWSRALGQRHPVHICHRYRRGFEERWTGASYWLICQDESLSLVEWNVWSSSYEVWCYNQSSINNQIFHFLPSSKCFSNDEQKCWNAAQNGTNTNVNFNFQYPRFLFINGHWSMNQY